MREKIVIVDDFEESCQLMVEILSSEYECHYTCQAEKGLELIQKIKPQLILLDYKMPYVNGVEICKILKEIPSLRSIPVIFISGAVTSDERIETLESGGDDFLSKPFHPRELMLRVRKRMSGSRQEAIGESNLLSASNLKMNLSSRQCYVDEIEVKLTPKQFEILKLLIESKNQVVSRSTFMIEIWGHTDVGVRNVDSQMNYLKKKIQAFQGNISSVQGLGYRLD